MIAERIHPRDLDAKRAVNKIVRQVKASTDGIDWYRDARRIACDLSFESGHDLEVCAAVIAALSPQCEWKTNVILAEQVVLKKAVTKAFTTQDRLRAAKRILAGEDIETVLRTPKVHQFWRCIVSAGESDDVCIDTHAIKYIDERVDANKIFKATRQYRRVQQMYRDAAKKVKLHPPQVQAICWVARKNGQVVR